MAKKKVKRKKLKQTFTRKEVIELLRHWCEMQRITCQLPLFAVQKYLSKEDFDKLCNKVRFDCDVERVSSFEKYIGKEFE